MADNWKTQQVQELQANSLMESQELSIPDSKSSEMDFPADLVINDILSESIKSEDSIVKQPSPHISFRALARLVLTLKGSPKKEPTHQSENIDYWRNLAESRGEANKRFQRVIEIQQKRIDTLENDLRNLITMARETQKLLAEIGVEKRASQELGQGETAN
ncbi:uncharacterized protein LOC108110928 [Drosophila eugracilis]|uniref:uncharacterized protein LOC108110928 n=1 Tax=Drosophila eugracilis TaxID=29029 RepID=UPI001BDB0CFA|nr:uncharacterized protein LOC108110928 [Drosophila eugracilis]